MKFVGWVYFIVYLFFLACALLFLYTSRKFQIWLEQAFIIILLDYYGLCSRSWYWISRFECSEEIGLIILIHYYCLVFFGRIHGTRRNIKYLPSIATGIIGMFSGYILLNKESLGQRLNKLFFTGFLLLFLGDLVQWFFP